MTLEKYIAGIRKHLKCDSIRCKRNYDCDTCEFVISIDEVPSDKEILGYFEELKDLREKYKNLAEAFNRVNDSVFYTTQELHRIRRELQKAREQE